MRILEVSLIHSIYPLEGSMMTAAIRATDRVGIEDGTEFLTVYLKPDTGLRLRIPYSNVRCVKHSSEVAQETDGERRPSPETAPRGKEKGSKSK